MPGQYQMSPREAQIEAEKKCDRGELYLRKRVVERLEEQELVAYEKDVEW